MSDQIVHTPPTSVNDATLENVDAMIGEVAAIVGGDKNPEDRAKALACLDRAADRMNAVGVYLFRQAEETYSSLTLGQTTLTKPSDWGWPLHPGFSYDSDSNLIGHMEWKTWDIFESLIHESTNSIPSYLSLRSDLSDEIYVWPYIDNTKVSSIKINYLARIQRPSETSSLVIQPETREALISGGIFLMAQYRYLSQPGVWIPLRKEFQDMIDAAKGAARRWIGAAAPTVYVDTSGRLFMPSGNITSNARIGTPSVFIKV